MRNGYNLEFRHKVEKTACFDYMENNFVNACILQFPYGRGALMNYEKGLMVVSLRRQLI